MTGYEIRAATEADRAEIVALQDSFLGAGTAGTASYLDWKYRANPYLDGRYSVVGRKDGELVGMVGVFGSSWRAGDRRLVLPCVSETVIYPEHRGGPLFHLMLDEARALLREGGVPWLLDFGDQGAGPAMLLRGWREVGPWGQAALRRDKAVLTDMAWHQRPIAYGEASGLPLRCLPSTDIAAMAAVVRRLPVDGRLRPDRDETYFRRRADNPLARYFHLVAGDDPQGYLIGHRSAVDTDEGDTPTTIVDVEAMSDEVFADLVRTAYELLPGRVVLLWTRDLPPSRRTLLWELGAEPDEPVGRFTRDKFLPNLMIRETGAPVPRGLPDPDRAGSWDMRGVSGRAWR
ncbi:GNAT family N-acetyltransferase [Streptomyces milbemycinicus]|uniref:GNAT family N-acetyltransferase n=1 Tax=Streptomyces milbemycinicus TaxID=476552 RepID=UPI0033E7613F